MFDSDFMSNLCGWLYVAAWGACSYPQIFLNYKLKSVEGFKLDYPFLNLSGFSFCLLAYSFIFFNENLPFNNYGYGQVVINQIFSHTFQIRIQDLVFVCHNFVLNVILNFQALIYQRGKNSLSKLSILFVVFAWTSVILFYLDFQIFGIIEISSRFNLFLYLGYLKMFVNLTKYAPLVTIILSDLFKTSGFWNHRRKSTKGFCMKGFVFDFAGAIFSMLQGIIDFSSGSTTVLNPIKFGLALISMAYDLLLFYQYIIYNKYQKGKDQKDLKLDYKVSFPNLSATNLLSFGFRLGKKGEVKHTPIDIELLKNLEDLSVLSK